MNIAWNERRRGRNTYNMPPELICYRHNTAGTKINGRCTLDNLLPQTSASLSN